jgi:cytochrome c biogenesis protein CcdA
MSSAFDSKQKSLKRRFLFILGLVVFVCFFSFGVMIIFWDGIAQDMPVYQRRIFGGLVIAYSIVRFSRLLRKDKDE